MTTTFVLGAGSNLGLDNTSQLPLGHQLALRIQSQISAELQEQTQFPQGHIGSALSRSPQGLTSDHVEAMRRIENAIVFKDSIDDLVDEWSDMPALSEVAKVAIAVEILKGEATTQLKSALQSSSPVSSVMRFIREHWFGKVLRFSNPSGRRRDVQDCLKNIRFITFNYDRCLEVSLYLFLHYGQSVSREKCIEIIEQIDIVHAYGSLGKIPELGGNRTFGSFDSGEALWASTEIMTYSEEQKSGQIDNIRDLIENSEKLVFLGFGYHPKNLKLLFRNLNTSRKIFGTTFGLDEQQLHDLRLNFQRNFGKIETLSGDCSSAVEQLRSTIF